MKRFFVLSVLLVIIFSSCDQMFGKRIHGNGHIKTETRTALDFNSIDVSGSIDVIIRHDSVRSIKIETDENLLEYVQVIDEGDKLVIHTERGFRLNTTKGIKVYISSPIFRYLEASGACNYFSENKISSSEKISFDLSGSCDVKVELDAPAVEADLSGACSVQLKGKTKDLRVEGSGSSDFKCMELLAENVEVDISGSGYAEVYASVKLDVSVSGSGDIKYKGNATVSQHVSGAGSVKKVD